MINISCSMMATSNQSEDQTIDFYKIPVRVLRPRTREKLSCMLNKPKVLLSSERLPRDWRGLAHLMEIEVLSAWFLNGNYVEKLLHIWEKKSDSTLGELQNFFVRIDRYDVYDDTYNMFKEDSSLYLHSINITDCVFISEKLPDIDKIILTFDDVRRVNNGDSPQIYDAFVLYVDNDREFANDLIQNLEKNYDLKLCVKDRDLVGGLTFEHSAIMELISDRCRRLIVILSDEFLRSDRHTFFVKYAQSLTYEQGGLRKVIPCMYKNCQLPSEIRPYYTLKYEENNNYCNFWQQLADSIAIRKEIELYHDGVFIEEIKPVEALKPISHFENSEENASLEKKVERPTTSKSCVISGFLNTFKSKKKKRKSITCTS